VILKRRRNSKYVHSRDSKANEKKIDTVAITAIAISVAGIAGAFHYGVAPAANIINVKVVCKGYTIKSVIRAIDDVSMEHEANKKKKKGWDFRGSVINMFVLWRMPKSSYGLLILLGPLVVTAGNGNSAMP
jgi:hypothetical protein